MGYPCPRIHALRPALNDPDDNAPRLELDSFVPYRLSVLSNTVSAGIARLYHRRFNLSIPEWRVMAVLGRYPDLSAGEVAERTAMDKVAVSRAVARLLEGGRVERQLASSDRRRSILRLSSSGRAVYRKVVPLALALETALLEVLNDEERALLDDLLERLTERARSLESDR